MAKQLGFKPHSLVRNIPAKPQPWKMPVSEGVRHLHAKRFGWDGESRPDPDDAISPELRVELVAPCDLEDLLPQWDTVNEEPYFVRESDGMVFSLEEAGQYLMVRDAALREVENQSGDDNESVTGD